MRSSQMPKCVTFQKPDALISARTKAQLKNPPKTENSAQALKTQGQENSQKPPSQPPLTHEKEPIPKGVKIEVEIQPSKGDNILRHFISSLGADPADGARLGGIIRSHGSCEVRHWERDTQWKEDACLLRRANAACALALIRTGVQALLRRTVKRPLPVIFEDVAHDLNLGLSWLKQRVL